MDPYGEERILLFKDVVEQSARRVMYKLRCYDLYDDMIQEGWVAVCTDPWRCEPEEAHRWMGGVMAKYVIAQKHLGMTAGTTEEPVEVMSEMEREMIEWALPQLSEGFRAAVRKSLAGENINPALRKAAFKSLSGVVNTYLTDAS